jgi:hypothetical protein
MVGAGWGVSRGGGDNCGALVGAGAFRNVPGGPAYGGGAASVKIGPSETTVSPDMAPQHSAPLPFRQQRRPNHGRSGQQKQQPQAISKLPAKIIDIQRARTMRWVPLSGKNGPNRPGDSSREPGLGHESAQLRAGETRATIMPQELEEANGFEKRNGPRLLNRGAGRFRSATAG